MNLLGVFKQIPFPKVSLTTNSITALHETGEGGMVVDAAHMICVLALDLKGLLVVGAF